MRLTGTEDLRVQKTIEGIRRAFEELMLERGFDAITVKDLCERARINKKTFYRYYPALEYLLAEVQEEYIEEYLARARNLSLPKDVGAVTDTFFRFLEDKGPLCEAITSQSRFDIVRGTMMERVLGERRAAAEESGNPPDPYLTAFVTNATLGVYRQWVASGKDISLDELIERTTRFFVAGIGA